MVSWAHQYRTFAMRAIIKNLNVLLTFSVNCPLPVCLRNPFSDVGGTVKVGGE
jgi:hypothetical protein